MKGLGGGVVIKKESSPAAVVVDFAVASGQQNLQLIPLSN